MKMVLVMIHDQHGSSTWINMIKYCCLDCVPTPPTHMLPIALESFSKLLNHSCTKCPSIFSSNTVYQSGIAGVLKKFQWQNAIILLIALLPLPTTSNGPPNSLPRFRRPSPKFQIIPGLYSSKDARR